MRLLQNARIYTLDNAHPTASAIAINDGNILALGDDELLAAHEGAKHEDMGGQIILPGLKDAHIHFQEYALSLRSVGYEVDTKEAILLRVGERLSHTRHGDWVRGHGWNQNTWGGEWPIAGEFEAISSEIPAYLKAKSLHAAWANSTALMLAGINPTTPDPVNGRIQRDDRGVPTGILFEEAVKLVEAVIPKPTLAALAVNFQLIISNLWRMGLTGVHDFDKDACFQALQILHEREDLHFRVVMSIPYELLPDAGAIGLRSGSGDDFLRIGSVKFFVDCALGPHTGAMFEPYVDEPQNRGILILDSDQLFEQGLRAEESGLSLAVHAIGDRAVNEVMDGFSRLRAYEREHGLHALRHRIEHVQTIHQDDTGRLAEMNVIASMQSIHSASDMILVGHLLGKRAEFSYAWRIHVQQGARLAFGSDAPVESPNPFRGLHAAVTRQRKDGSPKPESWFPEQRLMVCKVLEGFTIGPVFSAGMENRLGRLRPGFLADLIVVETDPFNCDPSDLYNIHPSATMIGGKWVWQS
jgi:predicted amidohydrolase YtcJ